MANRTMDPSQLKTNFSFSILLLTDSVAQVGYYLMTLLFVDAQGDSIRM